MTASGAARGVTAGVTSRAWRAWVPIVVALLVVACPPPPGLPPHAWRYFGLFAGLVAGLVLEPLPNSAVGLVGVAAAVALAPWVLFAPEELARPGFDARLRALDWALTGFHSPAVWLAFSAFMLGLGYEKTALGRRVALWLVRLLGGGPIRLGYAVVAVDTLLAPFTPSNTGRSAGIVYPVLRGIPHLYDSEPDAPSARRIGSYLLWTAFATSCVTSSLFLTALAPNVIAADLARRMAGVELGWLRWLACAAPFAVPLLLLLPLVAFVLCRPELGASPEVPAWAERELARLGPLARRELVFAALVGAALAAWILAGALLHPTGVAFAVMALMLVLRVVTWDEMAAHAPAWDMLARLAFLVTMADGLSRTGFVAWAAQAAGRGLAGLAPSAAATGLVVAYFLSHYLFATTTAHAVAVYPVMLSVGLTIPGLPVPAFATVLALSHGIMGVLSPYATGPAPVYHGSGYLPSALFWRLGSVFGALFLATLLLLGFPAALAVWR